MKGCKNLCNKETPHIDGVKVLRVPAWERGSICPALVPTPCIIKWKENPNIEDLQQESSYSNSIQLSNSVLRSYRSVCIRYSNLMLIKTSRDSVLIRTIYYLFLCTSHSLALCTFKTYYQRMLILAFLLTDQTH